MKRLGALLLCFLWGSAASAHDLSGNQAEFKEMPPEARKKIEEVKELRQRLNERVRAGDSGLEAVLQKALRWDKPVLTVCFRDGLEASWKRIASVANEWTVGTSIRFDFGTATMPRVCSASVPSDIRVSLTGKGNWSYVGKHAMNIPVDKATLNLSGVNHGNALTEYDRFLILHEFGHALGFEHEHQSPEGGCSGEFDWVAVSAILGWTAEEVKQNMTRFDEPARKSGLITSAFDMHSVMLYALPAKAFLDVTTAKCYVAKVNSTLSPLDRAGIRYLYPVLADVPDFLPLPSVMARASYLPLELHAPDSAEKPLQMQIFHTTMR